jgi:hypothetical protein
VAYLAVTHLSTLSQTARFSEKTFFNIKCVLCLSLGVLSETFFILRRTERDIIINMHASSCKVAVSLVRF